MRRLQVWRSIGIWIINEISLCEEKQQVRGTKRTLGSSSSRQVFQWRPVPVDDRRGGQHHNPMENFKMMNQIYLFNGLKPGRRPAQRGPWRTRGQTQPHCRRKGQPPRWQTRRKAWTGIPKPPQKSPKYRRVQCQSQRKGHDGPAHQNDGLNAQLAQRRRRWKATGSIQNKGNGGNLSENAAEPRYGRHGQ